MKREGIQARLLNKMFYKVYTGDKNSDYSAVISKLIETCDTMSAPWDVSVFSKCFFSHDSDFCIMPRLSFQADVWFPWVVWLHTFPLPCLILSHQRQEFLTLLPGNEPNMTYLYMYVKQWLWVCGAHLVLSHGAVKKKSWLLFIVGRSWEWSVLLIDWWQLSLHDSAPCSGTNRSPSVFRISHDHKTHAILRQHFHTSACNFWKLYLTFNSVETAEWNAEPESQTRSQTVHHPGETCIYSSFTYQIYLSK